VQATLVLALGAVLFFAVNWTYQVARKPSELLFPVSGAFYKAPRETWGAYGGLFRRHSTAVLTPDLLAALAQVRKVRQSGGAPSWRWSLTNEPFEIYRPASSASRDVSDHGRHVRRARRYCVHRHVVVEQGPWYDVKSCWFNFLYTRTVPSHAVELTAAYLDRHVAEVLERQGLAGATLRQKQNLAALIHLCGAGAGAAYVRRGFSFTPGSAVARTRASISDG
jgi:hypothetical protein